MKNTLQTKPQTLLLLGYLRPVFLRARDRWRAGASGTDAVRELCSGCTTIWFLGSVHATAYFDDDDDVSQLYATTTLTWPIRRVHPPPLLGIRLYLFCLFTCSFFCQFFNMHV
jgi:hypothetical protein